MLGWEEILHGDKVSRDATIFAWTSFQAGLDAATAGYPVVMAPAQSLYLDLAWSPDIHEPGLYWAGTLNLEQVYRCDPAPADFHANDNILGVLSPLWSELITSRDRLDYMLFPRMLATAEVANAALFLLSPRSSGLNGTTLVVDAGLGSNFYDKDIIRLAMRPEQGKA